MLYRTPQGCTIHCEGSTLVWLPKVQHRTYLNWTELAIPRPTWSANQNSNESYAIGSSLFSPQVHSDFLASDVSINPTCNPFYFLLTSPYSAPLYHLLKPRGQFTIVLFQICGVIENWSIQWKPITPQVWILKIWAVATRAAKLLLLDSCINILFNHRLCFVIKHSYYIFIIVLLGLGLSIKSDNRGPGAIIKSVESEGAAGRNGQLQKGDYIVALNVEPTTGLNSTQKQLFFAKQATNEELMWAFLILYCATFSCFNLLMHFWLNIWFE